MEYVPGRNIDGAFTHWLSGNCVGLFHAGSQETGLCN